MKRMDLQCLFIGRQSNLYADLVKTLNELDISTQVKLVGINKDRVLLALKKLKGPSLIFISDDVEFSLEDLSDLVWQFSPDATVVLLTKKLEVAKQKKPLDTSLFTRLQFKRGDEYARLLLMCLIQTAQLKFEFRHCKRLLGVSEKRCQWLVESSQEPIAYVTQNLHVYANPSYLSLFHIGSIQKLRSIPLKDLIEKDEYVLFNKFINSQLKYHNINRSIVISMRKNNGEVFRANLHIIPSVYNGKKCLQLWINMVDRFPESIQNENDHSRQNIGSSAEKFVALTTEKTRAAENPPNPFSVLEKKTVSDHRKKPDASAIILEIIKRKEASLSAQKVTRVKNIAKVKEHHFLSLDVAEPQRLGVNNLLFEPVTDGVLEQKNIFWDKVKFTRFFQVLSSKSELNINLLIDVSNESILNKEFRLWLFSEIAKQKNKVTHLIFVVSVELSASHGQELAHFVKSLKSYHCKIAIDKFSASKDSLLALKHLKPSYVCLSLEWVNKIKGHNKREIALASYIRQIELKGVNIIAPCGFDEDMRRLFVLSGVSFCQEKNTKKS